MCSFDSKYAFMMSKKNKKKQQTNKNKNRDIMLSTVCKLDLSPHYFDDHRLTGFHDCGLVSPQRLLFS